MPTLELEAFLGLEIEGRYRLQAGLGSGSTGLLFEADECLQGRLLGQCCLKIVPPGGSGEESFLREAAALARLVHPQVISFRGAGAICSGPLAGGLYLATELGEASLAWRLLQEEPIDLVGCARQLAQGLSALHAQGYVHGNLELEHVVLTPSGWKLAGFGRVRTARSLTRLGPLVQAKPAYQAPETYGNAATAASDVWALGVLLRSALAGAPAAGEILPYLIRGCLQPAPGRRLSADDLLDLLDCFAGGRHPAEVWLQRAEAVPVQAALVRLRQVAALAPERGRQVGECLRRLLATGPGPGISASILRELGELAVASGDRVAGRAYLDESRRLAPQELATLIALGELYLAEEPDSPELSSLLAGLYIKRGWLPQAALHYSKLHKLYLQAGATGEAGQVAGWLASLPEPLRV